MRKTPGMDTSPLSPASQLALLPQAERQAFLASCTPEEVAALEYDWAFWARPNQLPPPGLWTVWLLLAGRGYGKSRAGSEQVLAWARTPKLRIALVAETAADARDVIVEGESGLLACSPPWNMPVYQPTKRRLSWPNGTIATTYSGDAPEQLRGPQHHYAWCDEVAKWRYAQEAWDNLELGLRLGTGTHPQVVATTTPRPLPLLRQLLADPGTVVTRGSTYENTVNLAATFKDRILSRYEGTRLGRQELYAELLEDTPGALWTRRLLEQTRVRQIPPLRRIAIGLDPGNEAGIIVAGLGDDAHAYVMEDASITGSPATWAGQAVTGYYKHKANLIVAESNHGADMVITTIATQDANVATKKVWASQGKYARAEPVSALYEQGRVHHVGMFAELEDQLCNWVPGEGLPSPNELDALVWALTELMLDAPAPLPQVDMCLALQGTRKPAPPGVRMAPPRPRLGSRRWGADAGQTRTTSTRDGPARCHAHSAGGHRRGPGSRPNTAGAPGWPGKPGLPRARPGAATVHRSRPGAGWRPRDGIRASRPGRC
jgi:phage terminase large subunit-like protein